MQTFSRECTDTLHQHITFRLLISSASVTGPGLLIVSLEGSLLEASKYVLLSPHYTWVDLGLMSPKQHSHSSSRMHPSELSPSQQVIQNKACTSFQAGYTAVLPLAQALPYGAAIQLSSQRQAASRGPNYAISGAFLMQLLDTFPSNRQAAAFTPVTDSLRDILHLGPQALPTCSAIAPYSFSRTSHVTDHGSTLHATQLQSALAVLPWILCMSLFTTAAALAFKNQRLNLASSSISAQSSQADAEVSFCIRSKLSEMTPTKDTGCSPFVPVTQAAMPPPMFNGHLPPSCSSKIGSYRVTPRGAKPTASRALTTQTNTSGVTKWQRDKNGRLASLAAQDNDSTPEEFTSFRSRR